MPVSARRAARIDFTANAAGMDRGVADAKRKVRSVGSDIARLGKGFSNGAIMGMGSKAANGVIGVIGDVVSNAFDVEKALTRLQIAGNMSGDELAAFRKQVAGVSSETGVARDELVAGAATYVDLTGDVKGAAAAMSTLGRVAQASGANVADIATAAAAFRQNGVAAEDLEATFSGMITQGKAGAIGLKDLAASLSSVLPKWSKFNEGTSVKGIAQMGAAFQVARQGFGSASEAGTGMEALMGAIVMHAKDLRKEGGVEVFDTDANGKKTLKTYDQILDSIMKSKKLRNDPEAMQRALGGRKEAQQTLDMHIRAKETVTATGNAYDDLVRSGMDAGAVARDFATQQASATGKTAAIWNEIKNKVAETFTPERIAAFASALEHVLGFVTSIVDGFARLMAMVDEANMTPEERAAANAKNVEGFAPAAKDRVAAAYGAAADQFERNKEENDILGSIGGFAGLFGGASGVAEYTKERVSGNTERLSQRAIAGAASGDRARPDAFKSLGMKSFQVNVKMGSEAVVAATGNATDHRRQSGPR